MEYELSSCQYRSVNDNDFVEPSVRGSDKKVHSSRQMTWQKGYRTPEASHIARTGSWASIRILDLTLGRRNKLNSIVIIELLCHPPVRAVLIYHRHDKTLKLVVSRGESR